LFGGEFGLPKARLDPARKSVSSSPTEPSLVNSEGRRYARAKRKQSTFERLRSGGKLNRKQRREMKQGLNASDPGLEIVNRDGAGIDVGNESHWVAVPPGETRNRCGNLGLGQKRSGNGKDDFAGATAFRFVPRSIMK
jgi:hypothetical protein